MRPVVNDACGDCSIHIYDCGLGRCLSRCRGRCRTSCRSSISHCRPSRCSSCGYGWTCGSRSRDCHGELSLSWLLSDQPWFRSQSNQSQSWLLSNRLRTWSTCLPLWWSLWCLVSEEDLRQIPDRRPQYPPPRERHPTSAHYVSKHYYLKNLISSKLNRF